MDIRIFGVGKIGVKLNKFIIKGQNNYLAFDFNFFKTLKTKKKY